MRLGVQVGHIGGVLSVAIRSDARWALTGGEDRTARLWDLPTGREVRRLIVHTGAVKAVAMTADGHWGLTGSEDQTAGFWDLQTGRMIRRLEGLEGGISSLSMTPDAHWAVTEFISQGRYYLRLWDLQTGHPVQVVRAGAESIITPDEHWVLSETEAGWVVTERQNELGRQHLIQRAHAMHSRIDPFGGSAMTPDGHWALLGAVVAGGFEAVLWDLQNGKDVWHLQGHKHPIESVALTPDGRWGLTGSRDETVRLWDLLAGKEAQRLSGQGSNMLVRTLAVTRDARWILTGTSGGISALWDLQTGREVRRFEGGIVSMSENGRSALITGIASRACDLQAGECARLPGNESWITSAAMTPDGRWGMTGNDFDARLWDLSAKREARRLETVKGAQVPEAITIEPATSMASSVAISADGRWALAGVADGTARLWDLKSGEEIRRLAPHEGIFWSVAITADGSRALTTTDEGLVARVWDLSTGLEVQRLAGHQDTVRCVTMTPDGNWALTGSKDRTARMWDLRDGREVLRLSGHQEDVFAVALTPDLRWAVTGELGTRLWDTADHQNKTPRAIQLFSFQHSGWAVIDDEGRYDASDPDNSPALYWLFNNEVIELKQLKARFYTPGLLTRFWRGEKLPEVGTLQTIPLPPIVEVNQVEKNAKLLAVRLANRGGGIGRVVLRVNGRELPPGTGSQEPEANAASAVVEIPLKGITLRADGRNEIDVSAYDAGGLVQSRGVRVLYLTEPRPQKPQKLYAIIAGTSEYANPLLKLNFAAKDAHDIANAVRVGAARMLGDGNVSLTVLSSGFGHDPPPTKQNLREAFQQVAAKAEADDVLVVYFSGHGLSLASERDRYYYLTSDARSTDIDRDEALRDLSTVSSAELQEWLSLPGMPLKQVVILDTCAAGAANGDLLLLAERRELSPDQIRAIELLKDATGSHILMGSAADAVSYEAARYGQGVLTYALLQYLKVGPLDEGGRVDVARWFSYAENQVPELARGIGGIQRPVVSRPKGNTFPVAILTDADRREIHVETIKSQVLRIVCHNEEDLDPLAISVRLREYLRSAATPQFRGETSVSAPIVYLDSVVDDVPGALVPRISYSTAGHKMTAKIRLIQDNKLVREEVITGSTDNLEEALKKIAIRIIEWAESN